VPDARDYPARLLRDIDGMSFLVENILSFNRLTRGRSRPRSDTVSLSELVTSACDDARERTARSVALAANVGDASVRGDPELLRLLFRNLAVNAVSYNERDPEIRVDLGTRPDRGVEVLFRDNGVGIGSEEREAVFEDFHRGNAAAMARGTGLGLALCRRIMALHGGTIAVADSDAGGTTFSLRFR
jgi:two-component system sensor histidine kinase SenX3